MIKKWIKKILLGVVLSMRRVPTPNWYHHFFSQRLVPILLDPSVLKHELSPAPLIGCKYPVLCNPYIFTHINPFFFGKLYQTHLQKYIRRSIRAGDTVLDIGCNVGHISTFASHIVGENGLVIACEPNKELADMFEKYIQSYNMVQTKIYPFALGRKETTESLKMTATHNGGATLCSGRFENNRDRIVSYEVMVTTGDSLFSKIEMKGNVFLKIDVEGFEQEVLDGMAGVLSQKIHHAIIEITPEWIGGLNGVKKIFQTMEQHGFNSFLVSENGRIAKSVVPEDIINQEDVLFVKNKRLPS